MNPDSTQSPDTPIVSIVTVCLNAEAHLRAAMESVLAQTDAAIEYIVVDGGSSDRTVEIIREFEPRFRGGMHWISEPDAGLYDAMNKGIAMANGDLIGTLNADDYYERDAVSRVVETWHRRPDAGVIYGDLRTVDAEGNTRILTAPTDVTIDQLRKRMVLYHPATFVSAATYGRLGPYDVSHPIAADYDFFLRCMDRGVSFVKVNAVLTNFSLTGTSHRNVRSTDRDATIVRINHGVSPVAAWARHYKSILANATFGTVSHMPLFRSAYEHYKGQR